LQIILIYLAPISAPQLKSCRLEYNDESPFVTEEVDRVVTCIFTAGAPVLASLSLTDIYLFHCTTSVNALTTLVLHSTTNCSRLSTYEDLSSALAAAPSLTQLELIAGVARTNLGNDLPLIKLPTLHFLRITLEDPGFCSYIPNVYSYLWTPNLETLVIENMSTDTSESQISFFAVFVRTYGQSRYSRLRQLVLIDIDISRWIEADFIRAIPNICTAQLIRSAEDAMMKLLSDAADSNPPLWPDLVILKLQKFDVDVLCAFISSRINAECPLEKLFLYVKDNYPQIPKDRLIWLRQHVEVQIHH